MESMGKHSLSHDYQSTVYLTKFTRKETSECLNGLFFHKQVITQCLQLSVLHHVICTLCFNADVLYDVVYE